MLYEKAFNWYSEGVQKNNDRWRYDSRFLNFHAYRARIRGTRRLYNFNRHNVINGNKAGVLKNKTGVLENKAYLLHKKSLFLMKNQRVW